MTAPRRKFTQKFKNELCREVINTSKPIKDVADAYGVGPETVRNWLIKHHPVHHTDGTGLTDPPPNPGLDNRCNRSSVQR